MKVSIVIPVYGVEAFIEKCAVSLFEQDYKNIEYIFVNDATKDNSIQILSKVIERYPNRKGQIIIINKKENEGLPQARKTGVFHTTGDYVLHVDSDDWLDDNAISILVNELETHPVDLLYFSYYREYGKTTKICHEKKFSDKMEYLRSLLSFDAFGSVWNKIVKRKIYQANIIYPKYNMHEDLALTCQLCYFSDTIRFLDVPLYHYVRFNTNSICKKDGKQASVQRLNQRAKNLALIDNFLMKNSLESLFSNIHSAFIVEIANRTVFNDKSIGKEKLTLCSDIKKIPFKPLSSKINIKFNVAKIILQLPFVSGYINNGN